MFANLLALMFGYCNELSNRLGSSWNRFWFAPTDPRMTCVLRIGFGLGAVIYFLSHTIDLQVWFGPAGLLPSETIGQLEQSFLESARGYHWSYLTFVQDTALLWAVHLVAVLVAMAFALGLYTRASSLLTLVAVLSYVHRAPMLTGMWEPVLSFSLLYLCLAPCGAKWSFDAWRRGAGISDSPPRSSSAATVATRLIQVHLAALCFTMALTKLAGDTWWLGEAGWWLIARSESRLVDLTGVRSIFLAVNIWTHVIVLFELSFPLLIWFRPIRPLMLFLAALVWGSLILVTGEIAFYLTMMVASLAFLDADHLDTLVSITRGDRQ